MNSYSQSRVCKASWETVSNDTMSQST